MTEKCFVVEITPVVADDGSTQTFLFGTQAFATKPTDTPANTSVRPFLKNPGSLRRELFSGARVTGAIKPSYGNIVLANPAPDEESAGELDAWFDYGLSGSKVVVRYGTIGDDYPSAWTTVYIAYAQSFVADLNEITIRLRDRLQLFEQPIVTDGFAGTGGLEGTGGVAKKKQFVAGDPGYFPPILIDVNRQIYFVQSTSDGGLSRLVLASNSYQVYDNGIELIRNTPNYQTEAELFASPPPQGFCKIYAGEPSTYLPGPLGWKQGPVYFRLGSPPAGELRVFGGGYPNDDDFDAYGGKTIGTFIAEIFALRCGIQLQDIDPLTQNLGVGSIFVDDNSTYNDVLADSCIFHQGWYGFTRLDKFRSGSLNDPEDDYYYYGITPGIISGPVQSRPTTSKFEFNTSNVQGLRREPVNGMEAPIWKVSVKAGQTWPSQLATGASNLNPRIADYLTREVWTAFQGVSTTALLQNPGALAVEVEMRGRNIQSQFGTRLWLERYFVLYGGRRDFFTFTTPMTEEVLALELHDVVTLKTPRFGLSAGKKFRIVGIEIQASSARGPTMKFTLWGGEIGRFTGYTGGPGSVAYRPPNQTPSVVNPLIFQSQMGNFTGDFFGAVITPSASTAGSEASYMGDFISQFFGEIATSVVCDHDFADVTLLLHFDGANNSTTFTDSSSYARTVTRNGDAKISTTQSKFGGASGYFDGTGDYLSTTSSADFQIFNGNFTVDLWVYYSNSNGNQCLFEFYSATNNRANISILNNEIVYYSESPSSGGTLISTTAPSNNVWHHISLIKNGSTITLYVNGTSSGSTTSSRYPTASSLTLKIAVTNGNTQPFTGYLDDLRITKGVARYTSNFTVPSAAYPDQQCYDFSLVKLLLHFNGADNSTTFTDSSSANRTATRYNALIKTAQSKFGGASGYFDGDGDYLTFPASTDWNFGTGNFTIEAWFYIAGNSPLISGARNATIVSTWPGSTGWSLWISGDGTTTGTGIFFETKLSGTGANAVYTGTISQNTWHHVAVSKSGSTTRIFLNGTLVNTTTITANINSGGDLLYVGSNFSSQFQWWFNGYIDELRIIKGSAIYTSNFTPPTAPFPDS